MEEITEKIELNLDMGSLNYLDQMNSNLTEAVRELVLFARSHGKELKQWRKRNESEKSVEIPF